MLSLVVALAVFAAPVAQEPITPLPNEAPSSPPAPVPSMPTPAPDPTPDPSPVPVPVPVPVPGATTSNAEQTPPATPSTTTGRFAWEEVGAATAGFGVVVVAVAVALDVAASDRRTRPGYSNAEHAVQSDSLAAGALGFYVVGGAALVTGGCLAAAGFLVE